MEESRGAFFRDIMPPRTCVQPPVIDFSLAYTSSRIVVRGIAENDDPRMDGKFPRFVFSTPLESTARSTMRAQHLLLVYQATNVADVCIDRDFQRFIREMDIHPSTSDLFVEENRFVPGDFPSLTAIFAQSHIHARGISGKHETDFAHIVHNCPMHEMGRKRDRRYE